MKEAYYFSHDATAQDDEKIMNLMGHLSWKGYGLFWAIVEKISLSENFKIRFHDLIHSFNDIDKADVRYITRMPLFTQGEYVALNDVDFIKFKTRKKRGRKNKEHDRFYNLGADQWRQIIKTIFERDNYTCVYCGKVGGKLECDHVIPYYVCKSTSLNNLVTSCMKCNRKKGKKSVEEFMKGSTK